MSDALILFAWLAFLVELIRFARRELARCRAREQAATVYKLERIK